MEYREKTQGASTRLFRPGATGLVTLAMLTLLVLTASTALGQTLSFSPPANSVDCGGTVNVDVLVDDITDLRGYSLYVQFDPDVVVVDNVVIGADFAAACADNYFYDYDPVAGVLRVDASLMGCSLTTTDPNSLMTITFSPGANKDTSALSITGSTILRDSTNGTIGYTPSAGSVENICNTAPVVDPATFTPDENSANGTPVGTVTASDYDNDGFVFDITAGNGLGGFAIDGNTGEITVADAGVLDFETNPTFALTVRATDDDTNTPKSGSATVTINLVDVNEAPVLGAIGNKTVDELVELAFTATATDEDLPGDTLTFTLTGAAPGMAITPTGDFTWTPTEDQGPGSYLVTVNVSDGLLADSEEITIDVAEVNVAPVLGSIGDQSVDELVELTFTATATDTDVPANTLTFTLDAPAIALGMAIDPVSGVFTWTPDETQGPGVYAATITVTDNGTPVLDDSETISITVAEVNGAPVVAGIPDQSIAEGDPFTTIILDDYVTDPDNADDQLTWEATGQTDLIVAIVDRVATITTPNVDWNGSETITFTATDPELLTGADDAIFTVTGVNDPPTVTTPPDQTNTVLDEVTLPIVASDPDGDDLSYAATGLPLGLTIDPVSGVISGTVDCGAVTSVVQVTVTDDGVGNLETPVSFNWTINPIAVPAALTSLSAAQVTTGNDADGTIRIHLTWTPPTDTGSTIAVYRKGFGSYPEYDDGGGSVPVLPLDGTWTLVDDSVTAGAGEFFDEPATRDFWYYAAVVANDCGATSATSNLTGGTLNYHLGDVSDGVVAGQGENLVSSLDVSLLGTHYNTVPVDPTSNFLDVGPTTDFAVRSRPTTDNLIEFEDMIIMAINFGVVSKLKDGPDPANRNALTIFVPDKPGDDGLLEVSLWLAADGSLKGASIPLTWNPDVVKPVGFEKGGLAKAQSGQSMVLSPTPGTVDVALFGDPAQGIAGEGLLATVSFEVLSQGDAGIQFGEIRARDLENKTEELETSVEKGAPETMDIPAVSFMQDNYPNPFNPMTTFKYGVSVAGRISIDVYDVRGRQVATLLNEVMRPGTYTMVWDGTDDAGRRVSSGIYMARFKAVDKTQVHRMTLVK